MLPRFPLGLTGWASSVLLSLLAAPAAAQLPETSPKTIDYELECQLLDEGKVIDGVMRQRQHPVLGHQAFNTCADPDRCGHRSLSLIIRTMVHAPKVRGFAGLGINQKLC